MAPPTVDEATLLGLSPPEEAKLAVTVPAPFIATEVEFDVLFAIEIEVLEDVQSVKL